MKDWRIALAAVVATAALIGTAQAITDTAFIYSTAKNGYLSINPVALAPLDSGTLYTITNEQVSVTSGGSSCFGTGLNLPQGAKLQTIVVWYSSGLGNNPSVLFFRQRVADGVQEGFITNLTNNSGARVQATAAVSTSINTIDNAVYSYSFQWCAASDDNHFFSARIKYTYNNAGS